MAKKKRVKKPSELSLAQLQELVDSKASELSDLRSQRAELKRQLDDLDHLIQQTSGGVAKTTMAKKAATKKKSVVRATAGGAPTKKKKKVAKKKKSAASKNQRSQKSYAEEILKQEPKGLPLDQLADRIIASGYQTSSANFKNTLYQALYNARKAGKVFDYNEKTGNWFLRS